MKMTKTLLTALAFALAGLSFSVLACTTSEQESNDNESNANGSLCADTPLAGSISSRRDVDWYYLDVNQSANLTITLSHSSGDDFDWYFYPSSGSYTASAQTSNTTETGSASATGAGRYYVKVTRYRGTGSYTLNVSGFDNGDDGGDTGGNNCNYGARPSKPGQLSSSILGTSADKCPSLSSGNGGLLLMGGGTDVDAAFSNRVAPQIQGGDIVVLRTSGTDAYNSYLKGLTNADSVETLIVDRQSLANDAYVEWVVKSAEFVWIAGGDQSDYLNQWAGTKLAAAINHVYQKGGVIGGTSAGDAVQSQHIYDPDGILGVYSDEAVTDLCHPYINISSDFLSTPIMQKVITDTHFAERDRMGRLMVFMANLPTNTTGIGADEATSIFFNASGQGVVDGSGDVYILRENGNTSRTQVSCGLPVVYQNLLRYKLSAGDTFNLNTGASSVSAKSIGIDGRNNNFYINSPYN
ncbi:Type 1 glutamine amidotransferase-like domain-containing protein [Simiduia curdlanivorans]|uniref:Type 1 glutamine amidotransferase-like domain-containing protein n=1 Tax=Simiduia curdlanivorans TaxID=1492769 RepID=A0ABV8V5Z3_9GAMM|nr:Type 1 glutamine amidotransferase-like domain-containing protein [Simiduia curdlanivorans]MDN3638228.1 Type 1 glutamine amidotransferase-like domain-containing protein [Simiduia curdlanivorans]